MSLVATSCVAAVLLAAPAAADSFDQNVTGGVIFGSGNLDGSWTVDQAAGVELALRGKLRHNALGQPENTFNSNGDGTYSFAAGVAPTQAFPTAVWSVEWSINSNWDGSSGLNLADLTYAFSVDSDPGAGTSFSSSDIINVGLADHSIGDNATTDATDLIAADAASYAVLIDSYNKAQNSWKAHWIVPGFDPTVDGTYDFLLTAYDAQGAEVVSTGIQIIVGNGAAVPEPGTWGLMALGLLGAGVVRRRRRRR